MSAFRRGGLLFVAAVLVVGCATFLPTGPAPKVGRLAPEIQGIDADGASFKLSDYRGQVVLLDFWSST